MEKNGVDYQFISKLAFKELINQSFFAEWEKVHGFYYGTSKRVIDRIIHNNEMLLLEMDVKGALSIKKLYPNKTFSIFISPPSIEHLRKRLQKRGTDSKYRINIRLQRFKEEMKYVSKFDFNLLNDDLAKAKDQLLDIILKIKDLLYQKKFTIAGAREFLKLNESKINDQKDQILENDKAQIILAKIKNELKEILSIIAK